MDVLRLRLHVNNLRASATFQETISHVAESSLSAEKAHWLSFEVSTGQSSFTPPTTSCLMPTFLRRGSQHYD